MKPKSYLVFLFYVNMTNFTIELIRYIANVFKWEEAVMQKQFPSGSLKKKLFFNTNPTVHIINCIIWSNSIFFKRKNRIKNLQ